jgi:anhydro-N-acetylmuramic acid kinase
MELPKEKAMLQANHVWALGAMSGTSLDGVDAAMLESDGETIFAFGETGYLGYSAGEQAVLSKALGKWPGEDVAEAQKVVMQAHARILAGFKGAELVGFHGQTLAHEPRGRGTYQIGDGAALADKLRLPVVWDFRSEDVAKGGEGAPLAPFFHFACAKWIGATRALAFLNLGGVGNITWVDPGHERPEEAGALLAFDTGPANAPLNDLMMARRGEPFDKGGRLAQGGEISNAAVEQFLQAAYFARKPPKSLDRDAFRAAMELVANLNDADAAATLTAMSAAAVARAVVHCPVPPERMLVTGGGRKNPVMMARLQEALNCPVQPVEEVGLDGDMLEAQAFAYLAIRVKRGLPTSASATTGVKKPVSGGRVSHPGEA